MLDDAERAPGEIVRVLNACVQRSRPVYLEIPRDMAAATIGPLPAPEPCLVDREAVAACADEVFARLSTASRPLLLVGVEVRRYGLEDKVARLSRRLGLPVVTSFLGRGLLTGLDCSLLGTYLGVAGDEAIRDLVERSDALLLLGAIVCDTNFGVSPRRIDARTAIVASDGQVTLSYHCYGNIPLAELLDALLERARPLARRLAAPEPTPRRPIAATEALPGPPARPGRAIVPVHHASRARPRAAFN